MSFLGAEEEGGLNKSALIETWKDNSGLLCLGPYFVVVAVGRDEVVQVQGSQTHAVEVYKRWLQSLLTLFLLFFFA